MILRDSFLALVVGVIVTPLSVYASEISPGGGPVAADTFSIGYSGTTQAYTDGGSFPYPAFATTGSSITGEDLMQVVSDPSNVFCAGCLDFILQINSDSTSTANITSVSLSGYAGYMTDAGYDLESVGSLTECGPADDGYCNSSGNGTPADVSRSASGNVITFTLDSPGLASGEASVDFVVETNATTYVGGNFLSVFGSDSSSALNVGGVYSPTPLTTPTPEPSSVSYVGAGIFALLGWLRVRNKSRV